MESLGAAYARAGKFEEARAAFEKILKARPNSGFAFLALARNAARAGDKPKAAEFYRRFLKVWSSADKDLTPVLEAQSWLKNNG